MFERRLRIILWTLLLATAGLIARAGQIQLIQKDRWTSEAADLLTRRQLIDTTRGRILDFKGRELAVDAPCMDACVDYPAITEDWDKYGKWLAAQAASAAQRQNGQFFTRASVSEQGAMIAAEEERIRGQVKSMWHKLAAAGGKTDQEMEAIRGAIINRVDARGQFVMWQNFRKAQARQNGATPPWYEKWWPLAGGQSAVQLDESVEVAEETQAHVILPAISTAVYNELAREAEDLPGLVLRPGHQRIYPFGAAACHAIGRLGTVDSEQIEHDPDAADPLRRYWKNDLAGASGVEAMCESTLRGTRGERVTTGPSADGGAGIVVTTDPIPGKDVTLTIDVNLQAATEQAFAMERTFRDKNSGQVVAVRKNQPGAAVVMDMATNQVRALVSYPTYDLNQWDADYAKLRLDDMNQPLLDRACGAMYEPGSTVKPLMGLAGLSEGIITGQSTIECKGYLVIDGRIIKNEFRCWTMSEHGLTHAECPEDDPLPSNQLTVVDAVERSCDVFFETVSDHLGASRQHDWYDRFGLGRVTGIGLPEVPGHIPSRALLRMETWLAGIGQGSVRATPLQMANAAATIARDGVWMRPTILRDDPEPQETVDLHLSAENVALVKEGMYRAVHTPAGTGPLPHDMDPLMVAAKTGTAQASRLTVPVRDSAGNIVMENGREKRRLVDPNDPAVSSWYIGMGDQKSQYDHAWYIGYAPADHPRIAFAVFAEYGGSGGPVAGAIVHDMLAACVEQGYLSGQ